MDASIQALLRAHVADREARAAAASKRVAEALVAAEEVENNFKAALGLELNSCVANQASLERTVRQLRAQVAAMARTCAQYGRDYAALEQGLARAGPPAAFLEGVSGALQRANAHMEFIATRLEGAEH